MHLVARQLDRATQELWETSPGSSQGYRRFAQLQKFLTGKVRALEQQRQQPQPPLASPLCTNNGSSSRSNRVASTVYKVSSSHLATQSSASSSHSRSFSCDACDGDHFIVYCPKFKDMSSQHRKNLVTRRQLCFTIASGLPDPYTQSRNLGVGCLGRQNIRSCQSSRNCQKCGGKHHSMLHEVSRQLSQSSYSAQRPRSSWSGSSRRRDSPARPTPRTQSPQSNSSSSKSTQPS